MSNVVLEKLHQGQKSFRDTKITLSKSIKHKKDGNKLSNHIIGYVLMTLHFKVLQGGPKRTSSVFKNGVRMTYWTGSKPI